jgi:ribonuclease VapC
LIVDTSAIMAILQEEQGWPEILQILDTADVLRISAATFVELNIVAASRDPAILHRIAEFVDEMRIAIAPFTGEHAEIAFRAYLRYGKGYDPRARLNFGDCFAYALAKATGEPLLFVGDDFTHTDLVPAR